MLKYKLVLTEEMNGLLNGMHPATYHHGVLSGIARECQTSYGLDIPTFKGRIRELRETFPWPDIALREKRATGVPAGTVDDKVRVFEVILHPPRGYEVSLPPLKSYEQHSVEPVVEPDDQDWFGVLIGELVSEKNKQ